MNITKKRYRFIISPKGHNTKFVSSKVEIIEALNLKEGRKILQEKYPDYKVSKGYVADI